MSNISRRGFFKSAIALSAIPLLADNKKERKEVLRFIHITDSHMDLSDNDSVEAIKLMSKFINKEYKDLDFVLFGGDNFNNNSKKDLDALKFKEIIDTLHCPAYLVRGNKESSPKPQDGINLDNFKDIFLDKKELFVQNKDWMLQKKGYVILGLDSCIEGANNGIYTQDTIEFAKTVIRSSKPTIILNHHPYTNYWKGTKKEDIAKYVLGNASEVISDILSYENVILTLSGHKHIDSVKELNNTKVITTRGFIRALDLDMYPMRYIEICDSKISEKLIYTS